MFETVLRLSAIIRLALHKMYNVYMSLAYLELNTTRATGEGQKVVARKVTTC
jgi:hypothetical protein